MNTLNKYYALNQKRWTQYRNNSPVCFFVSQQNKNQVTLKGTYFFFFILRFHISTYISTLYIFPWSNVWHIPALCYEPKSKEMIFYWNQDFSCKGVVKGVCVWGSVRDHFLACKYSFYRTTFKIESNLYLDVLVARNETWCIEQTDCEYQHRLFGYQVNIQRPIRKKDHLKGGY